MSARSILATCALMLVLAAPFARAVQPDEILPDPAEEARARAITRDLRCLVCQNESIDASNAELARDLRLLVRERIKAGDTDREVIDYVVARYGVYVLLDPPFTAATYLLWIGPFVVLLAGGAVAWQVLRKGKRAPEPAMERGLTAEEEARLARLLADRPPSSTDAGP